MSQRDKDGNCLCAFCQNSHMPLFGGEYSLWRWMELWLGIQWSFYWLIYQVTFHKLAMCPYYDSWGETPIECFKIFFRGRIRTDAKYASRKIIQ